MVSMPLSSSSVEAVVDRSCDGFREIILTYFATDELFHYIADRKQRVETEMGFGDPYHKHPLRMFFLGEDDDGVIGICFQCELPITDKLTCYGCTECDYYIHEWCHDLPINLRHPLHDQHLLTRIEPPSSSNSPNLCNECQNPCLGRFAYHCATCQFFFHLRCLSTLKHEKHDHPLILSYSQYNYDFWRCKVCGYLGKGVKFGCWDCKFNIHPQCSLIPGRVEHRHVHELTLRHNFPQECDQVYCDLCEDKDGELDRTLSYFYCKSCDYIAHVHCCITQPRKDTVLYESFTHEHPVIRGVNICCNQCDYVAEFESREYPYLIKHPDHPEHTLVVERERCDEFNCTECQFTMNNYEALRFTHPLWRHDLTFCCENKLFRCDACGELGKGSRVGDATGFFIGSFDIHLECFALPGKLEHESHPDHPLHLRWLNISTSRYCIVCAKEMDPQLWFYFCQECDYAAHMDCVARDLLSTLRSSIKNQPDYCAIIEPNNTLFEYQSADALPLQFRKCHRNAPPMLKLYEYGDDGEAKCDLGIETVGYALSCPKCNLVISTQARHSTIKDGESSIFYDFHKNSVTCANDQTPSESDPLSFLDEQIIDELYCSICNVLIFPPTYSCASCQIFFHKSCVELPREILFNETTYVLTGPPFPEGFSDCKHCTYPISSFAYLSSVDGFIFDVQCALEAPLVKQPYHKHHFVCFRANSNNMCRACNNNIEIGTIMLICSDSFLCHFLLHPECGLLPSVIKHRIHLHPLELATDLAELYDEYVCDVCEMDLNPNLWAYRCVDSCGIKATSHVTCVITSKKKCHFTYEDECQNMTEDQKLKFQKIYGNRTRSL